MDNLLLSNSRSYAMMEARAVPADIRDVVDAAQSGDADCRELLDGFAGFSAVNAPQLVRAAMQQRRSNHPARQPRHARIAENAKRFHENAGTLSAVNETLAAISAGVSLIRISVTPDHFSNLSLYGQALFAERVGAEFRFHGQPTAQVVIIIDSEVIGDKRSRSSTFPDVKRTEGLLRLACATPVTSAVTLSSAAAPPTEEDVFRWIRDIRLSVRTDRRALSLAGVGYTETERLRDSLDVIEHDMVEAQRRARNLADFNMIFASRILNLRWKLPIAFISLREASPYLMDAYERIFSRFDEIVVEAQRTRRELRDRGIHVAENATFPADLLPFWLICPTCTGRVALRLSGGQEIRVTGRCTGCFEEIASSLHVRRAPVLTALGDRLVPRLLFDDLTQAAVWDVIAGLSNSGSVRHLIAAYDVASKIGLPVPAEGLLRLRGVYFGPAEARLAEFLHTDAHKAAKLADMARRIFWGKASILYYLMSQGVYGLHDLWRAAFERDESIAATKVADSPFALSVEVRRTLIETISRLSPR